MKIKETNSNASTLFSELAVGDTFQFIDGAKCMVTNVGGGFFNFDANKIDCLSSDPGRMCVIRVPATLLWGEG